MSTPTPVATLDERGRRCPAPIIALGRVAADLPGAVVELLADDTAARHDVPAWCRLRAAELLGREDRFDADGSWTRYLVRLPSPKAPGIDSSPGRRTS